MDQNPLITVIIVAYKRTNYILDAIKSVIDQTIDKDTFELIVIKNFSNNVIDKYIHLHGIKNILSSDTTLLGKILEGTMIASGKFISILEDDDFFKPNKLYEIKKEYELNSKLVYVHNNYELIDLNGNLIHKKNNNYKSKLIKSTDISNQINFCFNFGYHNNSCITIKKSILLDNYEFLKMYKTNNWVDLSFLILSLYSIQIAGKNGTLFITNNILTQYRVHKSLSAFIPNDSNEFIHNGIKIKNDDIILIKNLPDYVDVIITQSLRCYISSFLSIEMLLFTILDPIDFNVGKLKRIKLAVSVLLSKYKVLSKRSKRIIFIVFLSTIIGEKLLRGILMKLLDNGKSI